MIKTSRILVLDDDQTWLDQVPLILENDCIVETAKSIDQGLQVIESQYFDIILLDLNFQGDARTGLDLFRTIHAADKGADVIIISGETSHKRLIEVFNAGVTHFVSKPASPDEIRAAVQTVLESREIKRQALDHLGTNPDSPFIGSSLPMQKLREAIDRVVQSGTKDVLLLGETGTGKEMVARLIANGCDPSGRLVTVNCAAISEGLAESELFGHVKGAFTGADNDRPGAFELAGGGFIFLDEVGDMPLPQQAKLLRVIQERRVQRVGSSDERKVSFRSVSATNVDIEEAVFRGKFREDLLYRIAKEKIYIPPLRNRLEDIPELVQFFFALEPTARRKLISPEAVLLLQAYHWPGNIRQLKGVLDNIQSRTKESVIRDKDICQALPEVANITLPKHISAFVGRYGANLIVSERRRYERALIKANNSRDEAAKILGVSRATFFRKAKDLGLVSKRRT